MKLYNFDDLITDQFAEDKNFIIAYLTEAINSSSQDAIWALERVLKFYVNHPND